MKKFTLTVLCFVFVLTSSLLANEERQTILFWDYNTLAGNPSYIPIDIDFHGNAETEISAVNDKGENGRTYRTLRSASTAGFDGTPCLRAQNWEPLADGIKYWLFDPINVTDFSDIVFSSYIYSTSSATNKGPQAFLLDYRLEEDGEWTAVGGFVVIDKATMQKMFSWNLPAACNGCKTLAIRLVSNDKSIDDGVSTVNKDALNGLDNTSITGIKVTSSIADNANDNPILFNLLGRNIQFLNSIPSVCRIYDVNGRVVYNDNVTEGQEQPINPGIYIINIKNDNVAISEKIIVE